MKHSISYASAGDFYLLFDWLQEWERERETEREREIERQRERERERKTKKQKKIIFDPFFVKI